MTRKKNDPHYNRITKCVSYATAAAIFLLGCERYWHGGANLSRTKSTMLTRMHTESNQCDKLTLTIDCVDQ